MIEKNQENINFDNISIIASLLKYKANRDNKQNLSITIVYVKVSKYHFKVMR